MDKQNKKIIKKKVAIVIGSALVYKKKQYSKLKNTYVLPYSIIVDNLKTIKSYYTDEECKLTHKKIDSYFTKHYNVSTSQINLNQYKNISEKLLKKYKKIIFYDVSTKLSHSHITAKNYFESKKIYKNKVYCVEAKEVLANCIKRFYKLYNDLIINKKKLTQKYIDRFNNLPKIKNHMYGVILDINSVRKSGRFGSSLLRLSANSFKIKALGKINLTGKKLNVKLVRFFRNNKMIPKLIKYNYEKQFSNIKSSKKIIIYPSTNSIQATEIAQIFKDLIPKNKIYIVRMPLMYFAILGRQIGIEITNTNPKKYLGKNAILYKIPGIKKSGTNKKY